MFPYNLFSKERVGQRGNYTLADKCILIIFSGDGYVTRTEFNKAPWGLDIT